MKKVIIHPGAGILLSLLFLLYGCAGDKGNAFTDPRDGSVYTFEVTKPVEWMTCNLNYLDENLYCRGAWIFSYDESEFEDALIRTRKINSGVLYDWETACSVCPEGWRLPTVKDWEKLLNTESGILSSGLGRYNISLDGRARSYDKFCIYSGITFWTSDIVEGDGVENRAIAITINFSDDGQLVAEYNEQNTEHAFFVRCLREAGNN